MRASLASGGKSLSQYSQFGRSSSAMSSPKDAEPGTGDSPRVIHNRNQTGMSQAPRPLQNRVDPFGELHAVAGRGGLMGNRGGRLHRDDQTLSCSRWKNKHWLICVCEFKGRRRDVWGRFYTELFFLDEPTALAAGHRPCFECRRKDAEAFAETWQVARRLPARPYADEMDDVVHGDGGQGRAKRLYRRKIDALPDGAFIVLEG